MTDQPLRLAIAALGGQGGGVLTDWLIEIAESCGYLVQSTSVPGVAQRTGATIYYLELLPRAVAERAGREPVMALMPAAGDVDVVLAAELAEAARMIQRGLVDPGRCTLIASTHRAYTIGEKSALGDGIVDQAALLKLVEEQARRRVLFDMAEVAERHGSIISSVLLGALCGSGALPFSKEAFASAIRRGGIAVETNLAAFHDACARAAQVFAPVSATESSRPALPAVPSEARSRALQPLLDRIRRLPQSVQPWVLEGARRLIDYQDPAYAVCYIERIERVAALEPAGSDGALTLATARSLALWMSFEDTLRVADLKTRAARFERVRTEVRAAPVQLVGITEFLRPRVTEIAGTLPAGLGRRLLASPRTCRWLGHFTRGRRVRTTTVSGFLLLHTLARLKRWRRRTLRYREENARIEAWLARIVQLAPAHYALALELARAQRLVKGYGETHERGVKSFDALIAQIDTLAARQDGAAVLARLQAAALADEEGAALARELAQVAATSVSGTL
jgi:indolepyruvate ferredoxin oxidoreductase beta subunit